jgi:dipeptidyl aminopeptidase/acylaminoacyl peptidase
VTISHRSDIRDTRLFRDAQALYADVRRPGTGQISDAVEIHASPVGGFAVFSGLIFEALDEPPSSRICQIDLSSSDVRVLTFGPRSDRLPKYAPNARQVAFLSDRGRVGDFQLYLLDLVSGAAHAAPRVNGWIEYLHWSPDGSRILLGVAAHGADVSGGQGAIASGRIENVLPAWMPAVDFGDQTHYWRSAWVYEIATARICQVSPPHLNVWEAAWCGNTALAAVISRRPEEGYWYTAHLQVLDLETGESRELYKPRTQVGWPSANPAGTQLALVEGVCSDRLIVAGDLLLINPSTGANERIPTGGVDVTYTEWRSDQHLLLAGHRGFETVVGLCNAAVGSFREVWTSTDVTSGGRYATVSGQGEPGDCVLLGESFVRAPEIAVIRYAAYHPVRSFDLGYAARAKAIEAVQAVSWTAPDGLEIQGWLLLPKSAGRCPLILNIHGGPVWHWRPTCLCRPRTVPLLMLVERGYAVFLPNPRGSAGRGQAFAERVVGDLNGADTLDHLSGLDSLVDRGVADPERIGVTGISYGGGMTAWLVTHDSRFAAAVAVAPHTNQLTEHLISNIPHFVALFLKDDYRNRSGKYFERSPVMYAHQVKTPTLNICGALDRCTPPEEALQFHSALMENGVESVLVTYPQEGHGVHHFPAAIDYAARVVAWFGEHMPEKRSARGTSQ